MNTTSNIKTKLIQSLITDKKKNKQIITSLNSYLFIHNVCELNIGSYLRWIDLTNTPYTLQNVVCLVNVEILDSHISIVCKTFSKKYFKKRYDDLVIFMKV